MRILSAETSQYPAFDRTDVVRQRALPFAKCRVAGGVFVAGTGFGIRVGDGNDLSERFGLLTRRFPCPVRSRPPDRRVRHRIGRRPARTRGGCASLPPAPGYAEKLRFSESVRPEDPRLLDSPFAGSDARLTPLPVLSRTSDRPPAMTQALLTCPVSHVTT